MPVHPTPTDDRLRADRTCTDREAATRLAEQLYTATDVTFGAGEPFRFHHRSIRDLHVEFISSAVSTERSAVLHPDGGVLLGWTHAGDLRIGAGAQQDVAPRGVPVALPTCGPCPVSLPEGAVRFVRIDLGFVETVDAVLRGRPGVVRPGVPALRRFPSAEALPGLRAALGAAAAATFTDDEPTPARLSLQVELVEQVLLAYGSGADDVRGIRPTPCGRSSARTVELARTWLAEHCSEAVTLADLCQAVRLSPRTVQSAFIEQTRTTPMAFLHDMRLDRVRIALQLADPGTDSVAEAARQWGFRHMGRFAGAYASRFGEYPAETLRTGRNRNQAPPEHRRSA